LSRNNEIKTWDMSNGKLKNVVLLHNKPYDGYQLLNEFRNRALIYKTETSKLEFLKEDNSFDEDVPKITEFTYKLVEINSSEELEEYATIKSSELINFYVN
jgi:hypothetical protein